MVRSNETLKCKTNSSRFCFVCTEYIKASLRKKSKFTQSFQAKYKTVFRVSNIKNLNKPYSGSSICSRCSDGLNRAVKRGKSKFYLSRPAIWLSPGKKHVSRKCFVCSTNFSDDRRFDGKTILNVTLPLELESNKKTITELDEDDSDDDDEMYVDKKVSRKEAKQVDDQTNSKADEKKSSDIESEDYESEI